MTKREFPRPLPAEQKATLDAVVEKIVATGKAEMILLYGSFARGDFRLKDNRYSYFSTDIVPPKTSRSKSDFDILVIVKNREDIFPVQLLEDDFFQASTPVHIVAFDATYANNALLDRNYFIRDILKYAIVLYNSGQFKWEGRSKLSPERRKALAQIDFEKTLLMVKEFYTQFEFSYDLQFRLTAFNLQQTTEHLLQMIQLIFSQDHPKTHHLKYLREAAIKWVPEVAQFFPQNTQAEIDDLKYFSDSYAGARYMHEQFFPISREQLDRWHTQVKILLTIAEKACCERIERGWEEGELEED